MDIKNNISTFQNYLNDSDCRLIAVSKTKPIDALQAAYDEGIRHFGENKVQELAEKAEALPKDIQWHMIGHLQRNKVKYIAPFVHLIHAVDSLRLLQEIDKQAKKHERSIDCLLQIHIAEEETKFGLSKAEAEALLQSDDLKNLKHIRIKGLMGMATNSEDDTKIRKEFAGLKTFFDKIKIGISGKSIDLKELSMGMSGDYKIAIEEGSSLIRVGSAIFGARG